MAKSLEKNIYEFGAFRLDPVKRLLLRDGEQVQLAPKALETLVVLVENRGRVVEKAELMNQIWPDSFVEEINLTVNISALRRALGESPNEHRYIVTVPRRGYCFVADVRLVSADESSSATADPQTSFVEAPTAAVANETGGSINPSPSKRPKGKTGKPVGRIAGIAAVLGALGLSFTIGWYFIRSTPEPTRLLAGKSVAVLPFKYIGAEDQHDLAMGMADALITRMSKLDQISVRPTSTIFRYGGQATDALTAGRELRVEAVMEGTIQLSN